MDTADDGTRTARSLAAWLDALHFTELSTDQATARVIDAVAEWGTAQHWRVYRRAPSVFPLPPPLRGNSVLDVACGPGLVACALAEVARSVTGIDLTPAMIDQARTRQQSGTCPT